MRAALSKRAAGEARPEEDLDLAVRQIISRAVASEGVLDIFAAAGLDTPDISVLSDEFLAEVRGMPHRNLAVELLFIDARKRGQMVDRTHRDLPADDIARVAGVYHAWRGEPDAGAYADVPGFCKSATLEEVRRHGHVLTPGRYVGAEPQEDDGEPFAEKMARLAAEWRGQRSEAARLDAEIEANLQSLGFGADDAEKGR